MAGSPNPTPSEIRFGTVLRAILGSAMIAALGVLWVLQSREHQQLQDQITLSKSNCTVLTHLIRQDGRELDPLLTRPALLAKVQELGLGLTNITYLQVVKVTNSSRERALDITSRRPSPQAPVPAIATAVPR